MVSAGGSGGGNGTVTYAVAPNTGQTSRTGTLTIVGLNFSVTQDRPVPVSAGVLHQSTTGSHVNSASSAGVLSWEHTVLPGAYRVLVVTTALHSSSGAVVTGVTYNGSALTKKTSINPSYAEEAGLWYMVEPPVGTYRVEVSYSRGHSGLEARATTYTGVNPYRPFSNVAAAAGTSAGPATVTVGSKEGGPRP